MSDALAHLDAAIAALCLEAYRGRDPESMSPVEHFTIGEDLKRIDSAIGPTGESVFARIADNIEAAYVELLAARALIAAGPSPEPRLEATDELAAIYKAVFRDVFDRWLNNEGGIPQQNIGLIATKAALQAVFDELATAAEDGR